MRIRPVRIARAPAPDEHLSWTLYDCVVSAELRRRLDASQISGIEFHDLVVSGSDTPIAEAFQMRVAGCVSAFDYGVDISLTDYCIACGSNTFTLHSAKSVNLERIAAASKYDCFVIWPLGYWFASERFRKIVKALAPECAVFIPLDEITYKEIEEYHSAPADRLNELFSKEDVIKIRRQFNDMVSRFTSDRGG